MPTSLSSSPLSGWIRHRDSHMLDGQYRFGADFRTRGIVMGSSVRKQRDGTEARWGRDRGRRCHRRITGHDPVAGCFVDVVRDERVIESYDCFHPLFNRSRPLMGCLDFLVSEGRGTRRRAAIPAGRTPDAARHACCRDRPAVDAGGGLIDRRRAPFSRSSNADADAAAEPSRTTSRLASLVSSSTLALCRAGPVGT